jgi:multiple sugar transport system substrate-binding protein
MIAGSGVRMAMPAASAWQTNKSFSGPVNRIDSWVRACDLLTDFRIYFKKRCPYIRKISDMNRFGKCTILLIVAVMMLPQQIMAGNQAERAIAGVIALKAAGKIPDSTIRIVAKEGNISSLWGKNFSLKKKWEQATGVTLDAHVRPNLPVLEFMRSSRDFDITFARQGEYPDLVSEKLVADLTPLVKRYKIKLDENVNDGIYSLRAQTEFDNKTVALPADGDVTVMYLRKDLLDNPINKAKFLQKYGVKLEIPKTWDDYLRQIEFFHNPEKEFYGTVEHRDSGTGWMFWMPRFACQAFPNQYLFDDNMHPLINSPAGIRATENYVKTVAFSPLGITSKENHYNYALPFFLNGNAFAYIITMAGAKIFNSSKSSIRNKFVSLPLPGAMVGGRLVRRNSFIYGNNLVVAAASPRQELAFLFAMWITDPDISAESIAVSSSISDPYRSNHASNAYIQEVYSRQATEILKEQFANAIPDGTGLPGNERYLSVLSENLLLAAKGQITPAKAMADTAENWEMITQQLGRKKQTEHWRNFKTKFPK